MGVILGCFFRSPSAAMRWWCQTPPQQIQVSQRKQGEPVRQILGQAAVPDFAMAPQMLDHTEGMLAAGAHFGTALINGFLMLGQRLAGLGPTIHAIAHARGEHAFGVVKHLWGHRKVRYRGLAKNLAHGFTLFALANLYLLRRRLTPPPHRCAW